MNLDLQHPFQSSNARHHGQLHHSLTFNLLAQEQQLQETRQRQEVQLQETRSRHLLLSQLMYMREFGQ